MSLQRYEQRRKDETCWDKTDLNYVKGHVNWEDRCVLHLYRHDWD